MVFVVSNGIFDGKKFTAVLVNLSGLEAWSSMVSENLTEVNDDSFEEIVTANELPTLVDFYGPSCGPCRALEPLLEKLALEYKGRLQIVKVNVNECPQISLRFAVRALPTLIIVKGGNVREQFAGRPTLESLGQFIQQAL